MFFRIYKTWSASAQDLQGWIYSSLTALCVLNGKVHQEFCSILYAATLCGLRKRWWKSAHYSRYRRLTAKLTCLKVKDKLCKLGDYIRSVQFGFGPQGGCEAVAYTAQRFIIHHNNPSEKVKNRFSESFQHNSL